jgi:LacI family transcriptional regulator
MINKINMRWLAEKTGFSKSTVSLAMQDNPRIALRTRRLIQRAAKKAGYRINPVVSHLMTELSESRKRAYRATLALLDVEQVPGILDKCGPVNDWVIHAERRAIELGYRADRFRLHAAGMTPDKLARIFRARGISGILIVNSRALQRLPDAYDALWEQFSCLMVGNGIARPLLNYVCNDQFSTALDAVKELAARGYRKPGLVMCNNLDVQVDFKFSAGFEKGCEIMYGIAGLPVLFVEWDDDEVFRRWLKKHKPDIVIMINTWPERWASQLGLSVPFATIDRATTGHRWPGMNQNNIRIGEAAAEQLITQIQRNVTGIPSIAKSVLIRSTWSD